MNVESWLLLKKGIEIESLFKSRLKSRLKKRMTLGKKTDSLRERKYELDDGTEIELKLMLLITNPRAKIKIKSNTEESFEKIKNDLGLIL
ncbi:MAG: hypothetical protein KAT91_00835 [Candidatus Aenigmarchaeota archaeon]|nr:hypothetical protein [Candidatus Aenigmarchaeota archaeon]